MSNLNKSNTSKSLHRVFTEAFVILLIGGIIGLGPQLEFQIRFKINPLNMHNLYAFSPPTAGDPPSYTFQISDLWDFHPKDLSKKLKVITLPQAKEIFDTKKAIFVDARDADFYSKGHIPGAINVPFQAVANQQAKMPENIKKEDHLVVYCGSGTCPMSPKLGEYLLGQGYKNILVFSGGWHEWSEAKYPSEPPQIEAPKS